MRSLPPPRISKYRSFKRVYRAIRTSFTKGYVSDPGAFLSKRRTVSTIKMSRFTSRPRRSRLSSPHRRRLFRRNRRLNRESSSNSSSKSALNSTDLLKDGVRSVSSGTRLVRRVSRSFTRSNNGYTPRNKKSVKVKFNF